jgi:DNA-binding transcriptional ArsR family regulator
MNTANTAPAGTPSDRAGERHLEVLRDPARAAALLDPERIRLMDALREAPDSASGLARRLGESRQRLNYHLRVMEEAGLVELEEERPRGNFVERVMRPAARQFVLDPGALGPPPEGASEDPALAGDRFSATHLIALAARTIREVAALRARADARSQRLATAGLQASVRLRSPS